VKGTRFLAAAVLATLVAAPGAMAIDLKMPGTKASAAPAGDVDATATQESLVKRYAEAASYMNDAQSKLARAFDLKEEASALEAEATALGSGATLDKDAIKKNREVSDAASAEIDQKIASGAELSAEGRQHYIDSFGPLVKGISATSKLPAEASSFSDAAQAQVKSASLTEKASVTSKLATGTYLAKEIPSFSSKSMDNFKKIVTYAQKQGIPVPPDATALLNM
jgi:hypothetical protein